MSKKISEDTKKSVLDMFIQGSSKAEIAQRHNISTRSVGRIIAENYSGDVKTIQIPLLGNINDIDIAIIKTEQTSQNCVVQQEVRKVMAYVRREIKGIEALTYLLESTDTPDNLERYRKALVKKLAAVNWWKMDVQTVKLGIQPITANENYAIQTENTQ